MFERIFVTTDGSVLGNAALPYAANLARQYAAPLTLAYVAPDPYSHLARIGKGMMGVNPAFFQQHVTIDSCERHVEQSTVVQLT